MLTELCGVLRNWFETDRISGTYTVENGSITLPFLQNGQFFRVVGSVFNDGVHQYPDYAMADETFDGSIWPMSVPPALLCLGEEIKAWQEKNSTTNAAKNPFTGALAEAGVSPRTAVKVLDKYRTLNNADGKAKDKTAEFQQYLHELGFDAAQMAAARDTFSFYTSVPAKWK